MVCCCPITDYYISIAVYQNNSIFNITNLKTSEFDRVEFDFDYSFSLHSEIMAEYVVSTSSNYNSYDEWTPRKSAGNRASGFTINIDSNGSLSYGIGNLYYRYYHQKQISEFEAIERLTHSYIDNGSDLVSLASEHLIPLFNNKYKFLTHDYIMEAYSNAQI